MDSEENILPLDQLRQIRIDKLNKLIESGINPYISNISLPRILIHEGRSKKVGDKFAIAGRIMSLRDFGKLAFADIEDESGKMQIAFKKEELTESLNELFSFIDIGDFIEVEGEAFETKTGEFTIHVYRFNLLTKSIRPLPNKHFGLKDEEEKFRQRYVDLILNSEVKDLFRKKLYFGIP